MAKKNREKKPKNRLDVAKELVPDLRNCNNKKNCSTNNCAADDRCRKTD